VFNLYLLRNKKNGKAYVGQTTGSLERRWASHLRSVAAGSRFYIHNAIRKHGIDAWDMSLIAQYKSQSELDAAEQAAIIALRTHWTYEGYNLTFGGEPRDPGYY